MILGVADPHGADLRPVEGVLQGQLHGAQGEMVGIVLTQLSTGLAQQVVQAHVQQLGLASADPALGTGAAPQGFTRRSLDELAGRQLPGIEAEEAAGS